MSKRVPVIESIGKRYGQLIVIELTGKANSHGEKWVRCKCDCGNEKIALLALVRRGSIRSCGCLKKISSLKNLERCKEVCLESGLWQDPKLRTAQSMYKKYSDEDISFDDFLILSQQNCFYCGIAPSNCCSGYSHRGDISKERLAESYWTYSGLDRIDNTLGHFKSNVVPCCIDCNVSKLDRTKNDFFDWIVRVYNKHCASA